MEMYKYFAFISYSSHDQAWGQRLQRKLEGYRMPSTLCSERGWSRRPLKPVFFAPTDIQPGDLSEELHERLRQSRHLIVVCSPHSARSEWVAQEIAFFHDLKQGANIHFFIVEGTPHSGHPDTECFNPIIEQLGLPEILGANIHERVYRWPWLNRERAFVQLITKLLGIEFDSIWQRHKRRLLWQLGVVLAVLILMTASLLATWRLSQPVDVQVSLAETTTPNPSLPPLRNAVVTLYLGDETKVDTLDNLGQAALLRHIPHSRLGKQVRLTAECDGWLTTDTLIELKRAQQVGIGRDASVYGTIDFLLWDARRAHPLPGVRMTVGGHAALSNAEGRVVLRLPLPQQRTAYRLHASGVELADTVIAMPHTRSTVILTR